MFILCSFKINVFLPVFSWTSKFATSKSMTRPKCCACHAKWQLRSPKCCNCHENATHLLKTTQKYCACHTKRLSICYKTRLNVTKCHACHAKRSNATFETSKSDPYCRTYHRHGHSDLARLRTVGQRRANTPSTPTPPEWNGKLRIRENESMQPYSLSGQTQSGFGE